MVTTANHESKPVVVALVTAEGDPARGYRGNVESISPGGIRLRAKGIPHIPVASLYRWNQFVDVYLQLPQPLGEVRTRALIAGVSRPCGGAEGELNLDLDFPQITAQEEQALRDSHPLLVVY